MNNRHHILILNRCYPPEIGATGKVAFTLASYLSSSYNVTLLVGRPVLLSEKSSSFSLFEQERHGALVIERIGATAFAHRILAGKIINYVSYLIIALFRSLTIHPRPDLVITMTDPPVSCLIGVLVSKLRGSRFLYNIQDLHPDMAIAAQIIRPGKWTAFWEFLHTYALCRAHKVVVLGEDMRERVVNKGLDPQRVVVIRHGADTLETPKVSDHPLVNKIRAGHSFVVVYAGNFGFGGAWDTLLKAAHQLTNEDIRFVFIGEGTLQPELEEKAKGLPHVCFLPFQPREEFGYVLACGDLHVVTIREGLEGLIVPSKLYPILGAGRPVLAVAPEKSDMVRLMRKHQFGLAADPRSPEAVVRSIIFAKENPQALIRMGKKAKELGTIFTNSKMTAEFHQLIEKEFSS